MLRTAYERFDLTGKTAIVTGGGTGLGMHMAQALSRAGATVMIAGRREAALDEAARTIMAEEGVGPVLYRRVDLGVPDDIASFCTYAEDTMGKVDILVGNAAQLNDVPIEQLTPDIINFTLQANIGANIQLVQHLIGGMRARKWGRIILSSSVNSIAAARSNTLAYAASKAGVNALVHELAADYGRDNITANALILGFWWSDMLVNAVKHLQETAGEEAGKQMMAGIASSIPLGRVGDPNELHGLVNLLASDAGSYITGSSVVIDGGLTKMMFPNPVTAA